ncbi:hypothetical protein KP79_PYT12805 [Mizuhopecten yessoensis]|uniref:Uncharacterized protein n=1 Tax=Mizuhopecten yessoensis TaxID=6573 RepID=A0A210PNI2_MIZYE|nr:hypothetical protein KP79_PYT12805 [Mizuhopecten yessoensis]
MDLMYCVPLLILGILFQQIAPECQYPSQLKGEWVTSDRGKWTFVNETIVRGITVDMPGLRTLDFFCIDQVGSTYLLQAVQFINIFEKITRFFACWNVTEISEDVFKYYSETEYDVFLAENIFGTVDYIATLEEACNRRTKPTSSKTFNIIARKTSLESGMAARKCSMDLRDVFKNVTFMRNGAVCDNVTMDGYRDDRKLMFASHLTMNGCSSVVLSGEYSCLYHVESEGTTFVSVWHNESYSFSCIAYRKEGDIIYATWTMMFCSANLSEDDPNYYRRDTSLETEIIFSGSEYAGMIYFAF